MPDGGLAFGCSETERAARRGGDATSLDENRTMPIVVMSWPDETTRTPNGPCFWIAEATVDGQLFRARSRHGVPNALARQLLAAGLADRPMVIRYRGLAGAMTYGSFHAAAKWTYTEGASTPVKRVPYRKWKPRAPVLTECPEPVDGEGQKRGGVLFGGYWSPQEALRLKPASAPQTANSGHARSAVGLSGLGDPKQRIVPARAGRRPIGSGERKNPRRLRSTKFALVGSRNARGHLNLKLQPRQNTLHRKCSSFKTLAPPMERPRPDLD
jgi:hypothetical protein